MAVMRLVSFVGDLAYLEVDATVNADETLLVSSVAYRNLTDKPMFFDAKRVSGASVLSRTVNAGQALTTLNAVGSPTNRTMLSLSARWGD